MNPEPAAGISLLEGRFARFEAVEWWDQKKLDRARVLVVGAGALGNEVLKNLALLGVGNVVVVDRDTVELSNLSRSVLFRESDTGQSKAVCAARAARSIYPAMRITPVAGDVLLDLGLGCFRWADVVVGALDNREARVFVNAACARTGRPWLDGGIEMLDGIVRGFAPPACACYECTMSERDWSLLNQRRSCGLLARRAVERGGTPTSPTTASVIGAIQAQEVVKLLHGLPALLGKGFVFEGRTHNSYTVAYPVNPDCGWHTPPEPVLPLADVDSQTPLRAVWARAAAELGGVDALELSREIVHRLTCPACGWTGEILKDALRLSDDQSACACGARCTPAFVHTVAADGALLDRSPARIGLPRRDIVWARRKDRWLGLEVAGDPWPPAGDGAEAN